MHISVIIAAGGVGSRMGMGSSKQLMLLLDQPVVARTAAIFEAATAVEEIIIVIDPADVERCRSEVVERFALGKVQAVVPGGDNRATSVLNGMRELGSAIDTVLIHDGARPLLPPEILVSGILELEAGDCDGVVFGLPATDTLKEVAAGNSFVARTPDRSLLWMAQTPQIFSRDVLEKAYQASPEVLAISTDDSSLVELAGGRVKMVPGSAENIKITTPFDLAVAEEILRRRENLTKS